MTDSPAGQGLSTAWRWRAIGVASASGAEMLSMVEAARVVVAVTGLRAHLLVADRDGSRVRHLTVTAGGAVQQRPDLPLTSVSSAVANEDGVVVAGARTLDHAPTVCLVGNTGETTLADVPMIRESGAAATLAAWPMLARAGIEPASTDSTRADPEGTDSVWVVWAIGRDPAALCFGVVVDGAVQVREPRVLTRVVLDLQVATAPGGVDVLWQSAEGVAFLRVGTRGDVPSQPDLASKALLSSGAVLTPRPDHRVDVWDTVTGAQGEIVLSLPPEGQNAQISWARMISIGSIRHPYLVWSTQTAAEGMGDSGGLSATARSWIAAIDLRTWWAGPATELPGGPGAVAALADRLLVITAGGLFIGWIGEPSIS